MATTPQAENGRMPPEAKAALETLRAWYRQRIEEVAEELRSGFTSEEYRGNRDEDFEAERKQAKELPLSRLEDECEKRLAPTEAEAGLVLAFSPSAGDEYPMALDGVCNQAAAAAALDVLRVARDRRWYEPTADEEPAARAA